MTDVISDAGRKVFGDPPIGSSQSAGRVGAWTVLDLSRELMASFLGDRSLNNRCWSPAVHEKRDLGETEGGRDSPVPAVVSRQMRPAPALRFLARFFHGSAEPLVLGLSMLGNSPRMI